jgi:hypothetical protein
MMEPNHAWHRNHRLSQCASADEAIAWHLRHAANCGCQGIPENVMAELDARAIMLPPGYERRWAALGSVGAPQAPELVMVVASGTEALRQSGLQL